VKHFTPCNKKAEALVRALVDGTVEEVVAMQTVVGCATTFDPGWEMDATGGVASLCQPMEADLYGCADACWWPAQMPDTMVTRQSWNANSPSAASDWRSLKAVYPKR
jgi:hypothetical protein